MSEFDDIDIMAESKKFAKELKESKLRKEAERNRHIQDIVNESRVVKSKPDQQERFLSNYIALDSWLLFSEAIPISLGFHPKDLAVAKSDLDFNQIDRLARASVGITLKVFNKDEAESNWRVSIKDFVQWAQSKNLEILTQLEQRFGNGKNKIELNEADHRAHGNSELNARKREAILHAALGALSAFPDECKTHGKISASAIAKTIEQNSIIWFGYDELPLGNRKMVEIISKAIQSAKK